MKISYNWLMQYLDVDITPEKLSELLTGCGLEVENSEEFYSVKGGLQGVVIGEVLSCSKHPGSDHLTLTTVDTGEGIPLKIVCGAPNVLKGQKVAVAKTGTTLYIGEKEITLKKTRIRGEISEGMICAEDELGLGPDHSGIMVLDPSAKPGMAAAEYFGIEHDWIFTVGLTPNRVDAASHIGVARDVAAVLNNFGRSEPVLKGKVAVIMPDVSGFRQDTDNFRINIEIEDIRACPRYTGLTMTEVKVGESPAWLKNRLLSVGLRPINNIVDVTNFVLMELGQPLHAFDAEEITGKKVIVRKYPAGTRFKTLDEVERELSEDDLMICSSTEPMCIAGVFGGIRSGVTNKTRTIFLESAYFDPVHIRRTARRHALSTDASFRFERGADYNITVFAIQRAALLIREIAGGKISSPVIDVYPEKIKHTTVFLSWKNLDRLIGKSLNREVVRNILEDTGMKLLTKTADGMPDLSGEGIEVIVPSSKSDVTREADVIEEALRIYGYNNVEILPEVRSSLSYSVKPDPDKTRNVISDYLSSNGFHEIMNNSLISLAYDEKNRDFQSEKCVHILNPISRDLDVLRQTLLYGMMESMVYNINRKQADLKFYEFGTVYSRSSDPEDPVRGYHEDINLGILMTGRRLPENWNTAAVNADWYDLKGYVQSVFRKLGIGFREDDSGKTGPEQNALESGLFSEGMKFSYQGREIGKAGLLSSDILKSFDVRQDVYYAELPWSRILSLVSVKDIQYRPVPRFPGVRRDLALLLDRKVSFEEIEKLAFETEKRILKKVGLFDVYEGENIPPARKSYALSFILRDDMKTLTDNEIEGVMDKITKALVLKFNAQIR